MKSSFTRVAVAAVVIVAVLQIAPRTQAEEQSANLADLYAKVASSVVFVTDGVDDHITGSGSGVIVHAEGFIVTAAHVVEEADEIGIQFKDGRKTQAKIVTLSRSQDLALLKVERLPKGLFIATLADSNKVKPGHQVFSIGAPRGLLFSITSGIISAVHRDVGDPFEVHSPDDLLQTDTAVNPGNSGGALFNMHGEVVGIAVQNVSEGGNNNSAGLGMAVPSNIVRSRLFENSLPYIGVLLQRIYPNLARALNWPPQECLLVESVHKKSLAANAGLRGGYLFARIENSNFRIEMLVGGDVIYQVGEHPISDSEAVHKYLHALKEGDNIEYKILRAGEILDIKIPMDFIIPIPKLASSPSHPADAIAQD